MSTNEATAPGEGEPTSDAPLRIRQAVRGILVTPDHSVLLCRFEFPQRRTVWTEDDGPLGGDDITTVWALPGGGVDPGESHLEALHREMAEEIGLADVCPGHQVGPVIWRRHHIIPFINGDWDGQADTFFHIPVPHRFEPEPGLGWDELRAEHMHELRWWTIDEIAAMSGTTTGAVMAPRRMGELLAHLRDHGVPSEPVDTGI